MKNPKNKTETHTQEPLINSPSNGRPKKNNNEEFYFYFYFSSIPLTTERIKEEKKTHSCMGVTYGFS